MILLSGHTLTPLKKIDPEKLSLSLKERDSTATLTYADMSDIGITSWFLDDTEPGQGIVWRVKGFQQMYDQRTGQVNLEHVINTLKDFILFGEITPAVITGHDDADECEARQAIEYILRRQRDWVLGDFDASYEHVHNNYSFNGDSLYDALNDISSTLEDAWWSYDMSSYPFQINITKKNDTVVSELRPGRNIKTISKTVDKTNMYTRFYPIGYDDLHITGEYVSRNENLYGVFEKVETDTSKETEAELIDWAEIKLDRHAEPRVTITVDGLELAEATGESLDRLRLGRMCRIPLAEFGTTLTERITELNYADKIHQRESVTITLSNTSEDVMQFLADEIKDGSGPSGGGGRTGAVQQKEDHAWLEDNTDSIAMVVGYQDGDKFIRAGEIGLALNETGKPGSYESTAFINADHVNISATQNARALAGELEVDDLGNLYIKSAGGMYVRKTESGVTANFGVWDKGNLTGGVMAQQINGQTGTVTYLKGDIVVIGNDTTIDQKYRGKTLDGTLTQITSDFTTVNTLLAQKISTNELYANIAALSIVDMVQARTSGNIVCGGGLSVGGALAVNQIYGITNSGIGTFSGVSIGGHSFDNCIVSASVSGNTLTLTPLTGSAITFSKAISSWTVGGGNGYVNVKANPQNQTKSVGISVSGSGRITSNGTYTYKAMYETSEGGVAETGATRTVEVDVSASDMYAEGWNDCLTACGISGGGTVYTGTWYGTLYVAPTGGAQSVPNCVGQATGRQVNAM